MSDVDGRLSPIGNASRDYKLRIRDVNSDSAAWAMAMANASADVIASLKLRIACRAAN
jgi:hypothetical protein